MKKGILVHYINIDDVPHNMLHDFMNDVPYNIIGDLHNPANQLNYWENLFHFVKGIPTYIQVIRTDNQLDLDNLDIELVNKIKQVILDHESSSDNRPKELLQQTEKG